MLGATHYDVIIIGSGAGGGTLALKLAGSGKNFLILERGDYLPREKENWDPTEVFVTNRYVANDKVARQATARNFSPVYITWSAGPPRCMERRFFACAKRISVKSGIMNGVSPGWPLSYEDFETYYTQAEELYQVHGLRGEDPTEPPASKPYTLIPRLFMNRASSG
jgi:choline dehydrogenase-like flavoprotein